MDDRFVIDFLPQNQLGINAPDENAKNTTDQAAQKKTATIRDLSLGFLQVLRKPVPAPDLGHKLEQIAPQLERHVSFQRKVKKWHYAEDFDAIGTEVYNISTRVGRTTPTYDKALICHLRYVAILMLEGGRKSTQDLPAAIRLLKASIKTAKMCEENAVLPLAQKILEQAADHQEELTGGANTAGQSESSIYNLRVDYFMARVSLARRQENDQLAEYMLFKLMDKASLSRIDRQKYLAACELFFDYGTTCLKLGNKQKAILWLKQCYEHVIETDEDIFADIRVKVTQNLAQAYLSRTDEGDLDQVATLLESAAEDHPVASWLYFLKLDYAAKRYPGQSKPLLTLLESMIRITYMTNPTFQGVVKKVHELFKIDQDAACQVLDLLLLKAAESDEIEWVEKALVTRVWIASQASEASQESAIKSLTATVSNLEKKMSRDLGPRATHAAQILLWKVSEGLFVRQKYGAVMQWCTLARASLFHGSGSANDSKLIRRITLCLIELSDYTAAKEMLARINDEQESCALNHYLRFRIEIRFSSDSVSMENIQKLMNCKDFELPMLYHCAIEAQTLKSNGVSLSILSLILTHVQESGRHDNLRLPALLRCVIKLLRVEVEKSGAEQERQRQLLCEQFEIAADLVKTPESALQNGFNSRELEWFSKNAHNVAVTNIHKWPPQYVLKLVESTKTLLKANQPGIDADLACDIQSRKLMTFYISLCTNTFAGRDEQHKVQRSGYFHAVCSEAMQFRHCFQALEKNFLNNPISSEHLSKLATVLVFEFEARVELSSWTELNSLIETANRYHLPSLPLNCMADLILASPAPADASFSVIEALTNASLLSGDCDLKRLSRWLRMLFTLSLSRDQTFFDGFSSRLLQVIRDNSSSYPQDEIQWLAARSFNHAVDLHGTGNVERCHRLCELALNIGNYAHDENLKLRIQENYQHIITSL